MVNSCRCTFVLSRTTYLTAKSSRRTLLAAVPSVLHPWSFQHVRLYPGPRTPPVRGQLARNQGPHHQLSRVKRPSNSVAASGSLGISERLEMCAAESGLATCREAGACGASSSDQSLTKFSTAASTYTRWGTIALRPIVQLYSCTPAPQLCAVRSYRSGREILFLTFFV